MRVLIIVFSPAGSTMKISKLLESKLIEAQNQVQILNITGNKAMFKDGKIKETLAEAVHEHDLICIGSPVYEKHLEFYVQQVIKQLPKPDGKWGKLAVPFVTYGGISSGIALLEAERLLKKTGRKTIAAMKIESSHIVSKKLLTRVNEGMPGDEAARGLTVTRRVVGPQAGPAAVDDRDARSLVLVGEPDLDAGRFARREVRQPPFEGEPARRIPFDDAAGLEDPVPAIDLPGLEQPAARHGGLPGVGGQLQNRQPVPGHDP